MFKAIITSLIIIANIALFAQENLHQIITEGERPSKHNSYTELLDNEGNHSFIPVSIIKGKEEGPVFTITSGVHGCEYPPIIAAQSLIQEIDPELLSGTLIIIPLSNPQSFYGRKPFLNPQDNLNLNRSFPGSKDGSITERIAHFITTQIITESDVFLDIHGGDANEDLLPYVCYYNNESKPQNPKTPKPQNPYLS